VQLRDSGKRPVVRAAESGSAASRVPLAMALGAVGVAGLGGFAYFGIEGRADVERMRSECAPNCRQADVDSAQRKLAVADVALGAGVLSLAIGTWLLLSHHPQPAPRSALKMEVRPVAHGGAAHLAVDF
jgi:hypothetical protein